VERVAVDLIDLGLTPATASAHGLIDDGVDHVALLEVFAPFLVRAADLLELVLGDLVIELVQVRVVLEQVLYTVEKYRNVLTKLEEGEEQAHVVFHDTGNDL
jgi:hypothetical protein